MADDDKLETSSSVLDASADAHVAFLASSELSRAYGAKYGFVLRAEKVDGLETRHGVSGHMGTADK